MIGYSKEFRHQNLVKQTSGGLFDETWTARPSRSGGDSPGRAGMPSRTSMKHINIPPRALPGRSGVYTDETMYADALPGVLRPCWGVPRCPSGRVRDRTHRPLVRAWPAAGLMRRSRGET